MMQTVAGQVSFFFPLTYLHLWSTFYRMTFTNGVEIIVSIINSVKRMLILIMQSVDSSFLTWVGYVFVSIPMSWIKVRLLTFLIYWKIQLSIIRRSKNTTKWPHSPLSIPAISQSLKSKTFFWLWIFLFGRSWLTFLPISSQFNIHPRSVLESSSSLLITCSNHLFSHPFVFFSISFDWLTLLNLPFYLVWGNQSEGEKTCFHTSCWFIFSLLLQHFYRHLLVPSHPLICPYSYSFLVLDIMNQFKPFPCLSNTPVVCFPCIPHTQSLIHLLQLFLWFTGFTSHWQPCFLSWFLPSFHGIFGMKSF